MDGEVFHRKRSEKRVRTRVTTIRMTMTNIGGIHFRSDVRVTMSTLTFRGKTFAASSSMSSNFETCPLNG